MKTTCQFLYDLRTLTGFISGSDLHELFRKLVGEPSPSGRKTIDLGAAESLCPQLTAALNSKKWHRDASEYSGAKFKEPNMDHVPIREMGGNIERSAKFLRDLVAQIEQSA